jgi:hypothetical protein
MTTSGRGFGPGTLRTGPIGFDRGQPAPLVLQQKPTQLGIFGQEALDLRHSHDIRDSTEIGTMENQRDSASKPRKC